MLTEKANMTNSPDKSKWLGQTWLYSRSDETPAQREVRLQQNILTKTTKLNSHQKGEVQPDGPSLGRVANGAKNKTGKRSEPPQGL